MRGYVHLAGSEVRDLANVLRVGTAVVSLPILRCRGIPLRLIGRFVLSCDSGKLLVVSYKLPESYEQQCTGTGACEYCHELN